MGRIKLLAMAAVPALGAYLVSREVKKWADQGKAQNIRREDQDDEVLIP